MGQAVRSPLHPKIRGFFMGQMAQRLGPRRTKAYGDVRDEGSRASAHEECNTLIPGVRITVSIRDTTYKN